MTVNLKKLQDALNRHDTKQIARVLMQWEQCPTCEQWANITLCKAPGCTAVLCPDCMPFHVSYHLEDDPKDQRPI